MQSLEPLEVLLLVDSLSVLRRHRDLGVSKPVYAGVEKDISNEAQLVERLSHVVEVDEMFFHLVEVVARRIGRMLLLGVTIEISNDVRITLNTSRLNLGNEVELLEHTQDLVNCGPVVLGARRYLSVVILRRTFAGSFPLPLHAQQKQLEKTCGVIAMQPMVASVSPVRTIW